LSFFIQPFRKEFSEEAWSRRWSEGGKGLEGRLSENSD
jgi:hypothetical protein